MSFDPPSDQPEPVVLVCAPADAPRVVPGSVFGYACVLCGRQVMIAPSGQRMLAREPGIYIICGPCYGDTVKPGDKVALAGTAEEMRDEKRRALPNLRRSRN
jgi:hypothetical protein